jgi:hypothetical protein
MINYIVGTVMLSAATIAASATDNDLSRYIVARAASCWTTPEAMRGISFRADTDVAFSREGHVTAVQIVAVTPVTSTFKDLAEDFADALKRCGPYVTEGMSEMSLTLSWPL